jgi:hypothetical protein
MDDLVASGHDLVARIDDLVASGHDLVHRIDDLVHRIDDLVPSGRDATHPPTSPPRGRSHGRKFKKGLLNRGLSCWHFETGRNSPRPACEEEHMAKKKKPTQAQPHLTSAQPAAPAKVGALLVDARALEPFLVDLPDGATQGMKREQDGWDEVHQEILGNQQDWGGRAGVTAEEVAELGDLTAKIKQIRDHRPAAAKLLEMMDETLAKLEDRRHTVLRTVAESVEAKATSGGDTLLAKYEKTFKYRSAVAEKAAKTRRSNAGAAAAAPPKDGGKPA